MFGVQNFISVNGVYTLTGEELSNLKNLQDGGRVLGSKDERQVHEYDEGNNTEIQHGKALTLSDQGLIYMFTELFDTVDYFEFC